jgi:hypothetical protein
MPQAEPIADDVAHDDWHDEPEAELPPRPRRKLLTRGPLALLAVLIAAGGFIGGVQVQKGQQDSAGAGFGGGGLPDIAAVGGAGAGAGSARAGAAGGAAGETTIGEVANVKGKTLYVTSADGNTIAVKVTGSSTITRTADASAGKVRPGDSVVVQGAKRASGAVEATSIAATAAGVSPAGAFMAGPTSGQNQSGAASGGDVDALFQP